MINKLNEMTNEITKYFKVTNAHSVLNTMNVLIS
jgi:hypothetical protein